MYKSDLKIFGMMFLSFFVLFGSAVAANAQPLAYVINENSDTMTIIDTSTGTKIRDSIPCGDAPVAIAVTPDGRFAFIVNDGVTFHGVTILNLITYQIEQQIAGFSMPKGIAISPNGRLAYVTDSLTNGVVRIIDIANKVLTNVAINVGVRPASIAITPNGAYLCVVSPASGNSSANTIRTSDNQVSPRIDIPSEAVGIAISPDSVFAYVATANFFSGAGPIQKINIITRVVTPIPAQNPGYLAISPDGRTLYVAKKTNLNEVSDLRFVDADSGTINGSLLTIGKGSSGVAITPDGRRVYVTNSGTNDVTEVDTVTRLTRTIAVGSRPSGIAIGPNPNQSQCSYTVTPSSASFSANGGNGSLQITTNPVSGCNWMASSNVTWVRITSPPQGSGNQTLPYQVDANSSANSRTGAITVSGQTHTITQAGTTPNCAYQVSATSSQNFNAAGGNGSASVNTANGCAWTASSNVGWLTITAGANGNGNGTVNYAVAANNGTSDRNGTLTIAGQTFTVAQAAANDTRPVVTGVRVAGKKLFVFGRNFADGALLFLNGQKQKKVSNDEANPTTTLLAKKSGNLIAPGATVEIIVQNPDGSRSSAYFFTNLGEQFALIEIDPSQYDERASQWSDSGPAYEGNFDIGQAGATHTHAYGAGTGMLTYQFNVNAAGIGSADVIARLSSEFPGYAGPADGLSDVTVFINGNRGGSWRVISDNGSGQVYSLRLPGNFLRPGQNTVSFTVESNAQYRNGICIYHRSVVPTQRDALIQIALNR